MNKSVEDIAKAVVDAGLEKEYGRTGVERRLTLFEDLQKVSNLQYSKLYRLSIMDYEVEILLVNNRGFV